MIAVSDKLRTALDACGEDDFNSLENRLYLDKVVSESLKELSKEQPVPLDYTIEIDYTNNSLVVHFSKEQTKWEP